MVAMSRSVGSGLETSRGQGIWLILCRAALSGVGWAAAACGVKDTANQVERAELLLGHGITPELPRHPHQESVDWARLDAFERGQVARELPRVVRTHRTH